MVVFGVKSYIVFVISWDIAFPLVYYIELPDSQKVTREISDFKDKNVSVVIIDLELIAGIRGLQNANKDENITDVAISVIHYDGIAFSEQFCRTVQEFSYCERVGRFIRVENKGESMPYLVPLYNDLSMEHFVGCFRAQESKITMDNVNIIYDCQIFCLKKEEGFYGLNASGTCACARFLSQLELVDLNLCNNFVNEKFEIHGGDGVFSVYSRAYTNVSSGIVSPTPECVLNRVNCPKCPEGRKGVSCEIIDCSINNGGCGARKCQTYQNKVPKWEYFHAAICECEHGYYAGLPYCEVPFDECANGSDLCDSSTTKCVDKISLYTCECKLFHQELDQYKCEVDIVLIAMIGAATVSMLFCSMFICCQKKKRSKK